MIESALYVLAALLTTMCICIPIIGTYLDRKDYKNDSKPGSLYKGYLNTRTGKTRVLPARISEQYLKNVYGYDRFPKLDYTVKK